MSNKKDFVHKMTKREEKMADNRRKIIYYNFEVVKTTEKQKSNGEKENV
ncbi:hypothetical protein BH20ACI1_BH20ACI1_13530 [soil metagenome]